MPPHSRGESSSPRATTILVRGLVGGDYDPDTDRWHDFTARELYIGQWSSLAFSLLTLVALTIVLHFFFRMKRKSFRQRLIVLVMLADGVQAISFFLFPIVAFTMGPIKSNSVFCQINGFILSVGIEASDIAVLYIAIHTGLYVFKPTRTASHQGLYPYRRVAYVAFSVVPLLLASLAYIHKPGYASDGLICNLPVSPSWPWLALSWIPRYIIFATVIILYSSVYFYVTFLMRRFDQANGVRRRRSLFRTCCDDQEEVQDQARGPSDPSPSTYPIASHGLVRSAPELLQSSASNGGRRWDTVASSGPCPADQKEAVRRSNARRARKLLPFWNHRRWRRSSFSMNNAASLDHEAEPATLQPAGHAVGGPASHPSTANDVAESTTSLAPTRRPEPTYDRRRGRGDDQLTHYPLTRWTSSRSNFFNRLYLNTSRHHCEEEHGQGTNTGSALQTLDSARQLHLNGSNDGCSIFGYHHCRCPLAPWLSGNNASHTSSAASPIGPAGTGAPSRSADQTSAGGSDATESTTDQRERTGMAAPSRSADHACERGSDATESITNQRERMRRQLRYLFMYPVVYVLVWIAPLVSYVMRSRHPENRAPYSVALLSLISLSSQGFASAMLFASREKPWRYGRKRATDDAEAEFSRPWCGDWTPSKSWSRWMRFDWRAWRSNHAGHFGVGPTKDEMHVQGWLARMRWERECAESDVEHRRRWREGGHREMEWWERLEEAYGPEYGLDEALRGGGSGEKGTGVEDNG